MNPKSWKYRADSIWSWTMWVCGLVVPSNLGVFEYLKPGRSWNGGNLPMSKVGGAYVWTPMEFKTFLISTKLLSPSWVWGFDTWCSWRLPPCMFIPDWRGTWQLCPGWLENNGSTLLPCGSCCGCSTNKGLVLSQNLPGGSFPCPWCWVSGSTFPCCLWYKSSGMWFVTGLCSLLPGMCWPWWRSLSFWFVEPRWLLSL